MTVTSETKDHILRAAKEALLATGYAGLSTRRIAEVAGVPLSQIHYHFGSRQNLVLAVLADENQRLLIRQEETFHSDIPLWKRWELACDYLDDDLASGYVRVLHEMMAAGLADDEIATAVRQVLRGWFDLLAETAESAADRFESWGPFTPSEVAVLAGAPFLGIESMILLGFDEKMTPARSALRKIGVLLRAMEERDAG